MHELAQQEILAAHQAAFAADGERLHEELREPLVDQTQFSHAASDMAAVALGNRLPSRQSQPFPSTRVWFGLARDVNNGAQVPSDLARSVGNALNALGITTEPEILEIAPESVEGRGVCHRAEEYFANALDQLADQHTGRPQPQITVYRLPNGQPAMLQKSEGHENLLTLVSGNANGLPVPAASIVTLPEYADYPITHRATVTSPAGDYVLLVRQLPEGPIGLDVGRISAFAISDPAFRASFGAKDGATDGHGINYVDTGTANRLAKINLADLRRAADLVLVRCGIDTPESPQGE